MRSRQAGIRHLANLNRASPTVFPAGVTSSRRKTSPVKERHAHVTETSDVMDSLISRPRNPPLDVRARCVYEGQGANAGLIKLKLNCRHNWATNGGEYVLLQRDGFFWPATFPALKSVGRRSEQTFRAIRPLVSGNIRKKLRLPPPPRSRKFAWTDVVYGKRTKTLLPLRFLAHLQEGERGTVVSPRCTYATTIAHR